MKPTALYFLIFLLCFRHSNAQDITFPPGKSTIYLVAGKTIKDVEIRKIDSLKIEYVKDGNLADIRTSEVSKIVFSDGTQKVFNAGAGLDASLRGGNTRKSFNVGKVDTSFYFKRLNIYFGFGGTIDFARDLYLSSFKGNLYQGLSMVDSVYVIQGNPQLSLKEDVCVGLEYNINSKFRIGAWFHPYLAFFEGYRGQYGIASHSLMQEIKGKRYYLNGSYTCMRWKNPMRVDISVGGSLVISSNRVFTRFRVFDTLDPAIHPNNEGSIPVYEETNQIYFKKIGVEAYALADIHFKKWFSIFVKPYITYDPGFSIHSSTFSSNNQIGYLPPQKISFTGVGVLGGIAFHIGNGKYKQARSVPKAGSTYYTRNGYKQDTIVRAREIPDPIQNDSIKNSGTSSGARDSISPSGAQFKRDSIGARIENKNSKAVTDPEKKEAVQAEKHVDKPKPNGFEIAGFILFVLGHVPTPLALLFWPLGIIFSAIALHKIKKHPERWKGLGLAKAVFIILAVELIVAIALVFLFLLLFPDGISFGG